METIIKDQAEQYYICIPGHSWATFVICAKGDLFIHSDWGYWTYTWRAFGDDFKKFLIEIKTDYLFGCIERNAMQFYGLKQKMSKHQKEAITALFGKFQELLVQGK